MTKILRIQDFINESKGAPIFQRTPDRFTGDTLNKNKDKYLKMVDKFYIEDIFNMPNCFANPDNFQCYGSYNGKDYGMIVATNTDPSYQKNPVDGTISDSGTGYLYSFCLFGVAMSEEKYSNLLDSQRNALNNVFGIDTGKVYDDITIENCKYDKDRFGNYFICYRDYIKANNKLGYVYLPIVDNDKFNKNFDKLLDREFNNEYIHTVIAYTQYPQEVLVYMDTKEQTELPDWDGWEGERTDFGISKEWKEAANSCLGETFAYISDTLNKKLVEILG